KLIDVRLVDDKAETRNILNKVSAQTENLATNLRSHADEISAVLEARRKAGVPIDPVHEMAVKQLLNAATSLAALDKGQIGRRGGSGPRYRRERYVDAVTQILKDNGITMQ